MLSLLRRIYFLLFLTLMIIPVDAQILSVDLNISDSKLDPFPSTIQFVLTGKDSTFSHSFGISGDHQQYILEPVQAGSYGLHFQLLKNQSIILEGFGRGQVSTSDTSFVKSHLTSVRDSLYLVVDWVPPPHSKSKVLLGNVIDLDTTNLKLYQIQNPDSLADIWLEKGMPFYNQYDVIYGILDSNLIPIIDYSFGAHRNPVSTAQIAFAFYEDLLRTNDPEYEVGFLNNVNWLVANHDTNYYFHYDFRYNHGGRILNSGWVSAMAQGLALNAVSMAYSYTGDSIYLKTANGIFKTLYSNTDEYWCVVVDENRYYWLEEYPNQDICHVLNGKIAGLYGIWEYYVITRDPFALKLFQAGLRTIIDHTNIWNIPGQNASYYCEHHSSYLNYHLLHLYQHEFLGNLFGIQELKDAVGLIANHTFNVYPATRILSPEEGMTQFTVMNSDHWEATTNSSWLEIDTIFSNTFMVRHDPNFTLGEKTETMLVQDSATSNPFVLSLTQQKGEPFFNPVPDTIRITADSGIVEVSIHSNLSWTSQSASEWLSSSKPNDTTLMISYLENSDTLERASEINISTNLDDRYTIHIIQQGIQTSARAFITEADIRIYPNPAYGRFMLTSQLPLTGSLEIYSINGEKVLTASLASCWMKNVDISRLNAGIYIVKVQTKTSTFVKRLIINKN